MNTKKIIIDGIETDYSVSDDGRVFNDVRHTELKGTFRRNEYHTVQLTVNKKLKTLMVHRLVAEAFCDNPNHYDIVDHINRDKYDNRAENLRWVDVKTNANNVGEKKPVKPREKADFSKGEWRELKDYPNYAASDLGEIVNTKTGFLLKGGKRNGYLRVNLGKKWLSKHLLIWKTFVGEPQGIINHIDGNKQNNRLTNLRDISQSENVKNGYAKGRKGMIGVTCFDSNGEELGSYSSMAEAAREFGVVQEAIALAAKTGTPSCGFYWLRDDCINSKNEFISIKPKDAVPYKSYFSVSVTLDYLFYNEKDHLIPQFEDENGIYCYFYIDNSYRKSYV